MKIFVAGATGVIGRAAVTRLIAAGHDVTGLARSDAATEQLEGAGAGAARIDLFDAPAVAAAIRGHDAVVNLATAMPPVSEATKAAAWDLNNRVRAEGSAILADAARSAGARVFVQESVAFLYPDHGDSWIESSTELADSIWTGAVQAAEANALGFAGDDSRRGVVLRFGGFYSAEAEHTQLLLKAARRGISLDLGRHDGYFPVVHVEDAAAAVVRALDAPTGTYDIVDDEPMTRQEQAAVWGEALGRKVRRLPLWLSRFAGVAGPSGKRSMRVSNRPFRSATGWTPTHPTFRETVADVLAGSSTPAERASGH